MECSDGRKRSATAALSAVVGRRCVGIMLESEPTRAALGPAVLGALLPLVSAAAEQSTAHLTACLRGEREAPGATAAADALSTCFRAAVHARSVATEQTCSAPAGEVPKAFKAKTDADHRQHGVPLSPKR